MGHVTQIETNWDTLKRIVGLLFGMAALADVVSTRPRRVRCEVLQYLRQAELVAWGITLEDVYGLIAEPDLLELTYDNGGYSSADAARLAVVLRMLAITLTIKFALYRNFAAASDHAIWQQRQKRFVSIELSVVGPDRLPAATPPAIPP